MKKTGLWKRFVLVDSLVVISIIAAYAWFIMGNAASVKKIDEKVADAGYVKISDDDGETWNNGLDIDLGTAGIVREMSGNGLELYEPVYGMYDIEGYTLATSDTYYIEKVFTFETDTTQELYLTAESFLKPANTSENLSSMGNFSRNYIAGAVRVGFFEVTDEGEYEPVYIWVPNPGICFNGDGVTENGAVEEYYAYQAGTGVEDIVTIPTGGAENGISDDGGFVWGSPIQENVKPVLSFSTENRAPVTKKLMVRVWLEGTDRECVKALHNGEFSMYFKFGALEKGGEQ